MATVTYTRTHVFIEFANPFLACDNCHRLVRAWHNDDQCGCDGTSWNEPCGCERTGVTSVCPSWGPVDGCQCLRIFGNVLHVHPEQRARVAADVAKALGMSS